MTILVWQKSLLKSKRVGLSNVKEELWGQEGKSKRPRCQTLSDCQCLLCPQNCPGMSTPQVGKLRQAAF